MKNTEHPLAEVFGYSITDFSNSAKRHRRNKLCPFNNKVPNCTKDKANAPLGVCSIYHNSNIVITCPVRFREEWLITEGASNFFFPANTSWTSIAEVNLNDANGKTAGHIDVVLVAYNEKGKVVDFGALEVQAVYISGNIRTPFEYYMEKPEERMNFTWKGNRYYPKPDYLSSSRKRLIPQILYKGGILHNWRKKQAVALQKSFFETLPNMPTVEPKDAEVAWLIYDLNNKNGSCNLIHSQTVYTKFEAAITKITKPTPGKIENFIEVLQGKLDEHLDENPPDAPTILDVPLQ